MTEEKKTNVAKKEAPRSVSIVEATTTKIGELIKGNELHVPKDYSPQNAVRGAMLIIQEAVDKNKKPVLETCTKTSIMYALFDMVIQGLNATKQQCYFVAYGTKLICQRSYFGTMALAKRADPKIDKIVAQAVYKGDKLEVAVENGESLIKEHTQSLESMTSKEVVAAYCTMLDKEGKVRYCVVMSLEQIKQSWRMSKMNPVDASGKINPSSTHGKFTEEMAKKTVTNRACKCVVNSSGDTHLVDAMEGNDQVLAQASAEEDALREENGKVIDVVPDKEMVAETASSDGVEF